MDWVFKPGSFWRNAALLFIAYLAIPAFFAAFEERRPVAAFAETFIAALLYHLSILGAAVAGIAAGMFVAKKNTALGWVAGIAVLLFVVLVVSWFLMKSLELDGELKSCTQATVTSRSSCLIAALILCTTCIAEARQPRSPVERHAFVKEVACPATGRHRLPCHGYHIDHIEPLCAGGADHRSNMQWLPIEDHKAKTRHDVTSCRRK